jgi:hypothetical protein
MAKGSKINLNYKTIEDSKFTRNEKGKEEILVSERD